MDELKKSTDPQSTQDGNKLIQDPEFVACSPEFANGCTDVEPNDPERP
ncbi:hypothetical protein SDC9_89355 [bioreactor metagenome]|uniref:Uncharacterized protein n=1 Tax=bioreactor metagenome TaxID=1076179 RepID=A0A644ZPK0_9ZZZZ